MSIPIKLHNDDLGDLFVTVTDLNTAGNATVINNQRININNTSNITVQEDGNGSGNITWNAQRTDDAMKNAQRTVQVNANDTIDITTFFG